jgi:hypothetical protein
VTPRASVLSVPLALAFLLTVLLSGCLAELQGTEEHGTPACDLVWHPGQVPLDAPPEGGSGERQVQVTVLGGDGQPAANMAVAAWWQATREELHVLRVATGPDGQVVLRVPPGESVDLVAGHVEWTHEAHLDAGNEPATLILTPASLIGVVDGNWTEPITPGVGGAVWQPSDLPWADSGHMARLERLRVDLLWTNGPDGGADFGIAVGPSSGSGFHYVNREYQATAGVHTEERTLEGEDFAALGWDGDTLPQAGPSVSTGGFTLTAIPYTLTWEATFLADPDLADRCLSLGDADAVDVTDSRRESAPMPSGSVGPGRQHGAD